MQKMIWIDFYWTVKRGPRYLLLQNSVQITDLSLIGFLFVYSTLDTCTLGSHTSSWSHFVLKST